MMFLPRMRHGAGLLCRTTDLGQQAVLPGSPAHYCPASSFGRHCGIAVSSAVHDFTIPRLPPRGTADKSIMSTRPTGEALDKQPPGAARCWRC